MLLADLCPEDSELKKDTSFLDDLGKWLLTAETSIHFLPFMNNFKKNYVAARRNVKKRIFRSKEQAEVYASSETAEEETADDLEQGTFQTYLKNCLSKGSITSKYLHRIIECVNRVHL